MDTSQDRMDEIGLHINEQILINKKSILQLIKNCAYFSVFKNWYKMQVYTIEKKYS